MTRSIHARVIYASRSRNRSASSDDNRYRCFCMTKSCKLTMVCSILTRCVILMNTIRCIQWNQLRIFPSTTTPYCYYRHTARYICLWMCKSYMVCIGENLISIWSIFFTKADCSVRPAMSSITQSKNLSTFDKMVSDLMNWDKFFIQSNTINHQLMKYRPIIRITKSIGSL